MLLCISILRAHTLCKLCVWIFHEVELSPQSALFQEKKAIETGTSLLLNILAMIVTAAAMVQRASQLTDWLRRDRCTEKCRLLLLVALLVFRCFRYFFSWCWASLFAVPVCDRVVELFLVVTAALELAFPLLKLLLVWLFPLFHYFRRKFPLAHPAVANGSFRNVWFIVLMSICGVLCVSVLATFFLFFPRLLAVTVDVVCLFCHFAWLFPSDLFLVCLFYHPATLSSACDVPLWNGFGSILVSIESDSLYFWLRWRQSFSISLSALIDIL